MELHPVSIQRHGHRCWIKPKDFFHAKNEALAAITLAEVTKAMMHLPLGFLKSERACRLVAMQGFINGKNLLVDKNGTWLAGYVPAAYRGYPFSLANTDDGRTALCIHEQEGVIASDSHGEIFFDSDGKPGKQMAEIFEFLQLTANNQVTTNKLSNQLLEYELIDSWPLEITLANNSTVSVNGLSCINEHKLTELEPKKLSCIRDSGALLLAYCQLISMQNVNRLLDLAEIQEESILITTDQTLDLFSDTDSISFDNI